MKRRHLLAHLAVIPTFPYPLLGKLFRPFHLIKWVIPCTVVDQNNSYVAQIAREEI